MARRSGARGSIRKVLECEVDGSETGGGQILFGAIRDPPPHHGRVARHEHGREQPPVEVCLGIDTGVARESERDGVLVSLIDFEQTGDQQADKKCIFTN